MTLAPLIAALLPLGSLPDAAPVRVQPAACEASADPGDAAWCRLGRFVLRLLSPGEVIDDLKRGKLRRELRILHSAVVQIRQDKALLLDRLERDVLEDSSVVRAGEDIAAQVTDARATLADLVPLLEQSDRPEAQSLVQVLDPAVVSRKGWLDELRIPVTRVRRAELVQGGKLALVALDSASRSLGRVINALR